MSMNDRTRLSPSASDALELLSQLETETDDDGRSSAVVIGELLESGFVKPDAENAVSELLSKGYLYEVNEELYVTPT